MATGPEAFDFGAGPSTTRQRVLDTAFEVISKDRAAQHGDPERNLKRIADFWSLYLSETNDHPVKVTPADAGVMMGLLKVARIISSPTYEDHYVDLAGYAAIAYEAACLSE